MNLDDFAHRYSGTFVRVTIADVEYTAFVADFDFDEGVIYLDIYDGERAESTSVHIDDAVFDLTYPLLGMINIGDGYRYYYRQADRTYKRGLQLERVNNSSSSDMLRMHGVADVRISLSGTKLAHALLFPEYTPLDIAISNIYEGKSIGEALTDTLALASTCNEHAVLMYKTHPIGTILPDKEVELLPQWKRLQYFVQTSLG